MKAFRATNVVLMLLCLMYFITYLDRVNVSTAAAGFAKDFNLSKTEIGFVFSAFAYPYLIFQIIGGWVSDRFGAKRTLIACGLIWAGATVLTGMAGGLVSLYAHLDDRIAPPRVAAGDEVYLGQIIGAVGMTGMTTGAHLHFVVWRDGELIDPFSVIAP